MNAKHKSRQAAKPRKPNATEKLRTDMARETNLVYVDTILLEARVRRFSAHLAQEASDLRTLADQLTHHREELRKILYPDPNP